mmetsp:Transcript_30627/g.47003  ORF Transcript_30627/g.47003 Transcript_30627/m.47003 type:complete len:148 (+) Transcript_30627:1058-1501(+)
MNVVKRAEKKEKVKNLKLKNGRHLFEEDNSNHSDQGSNSDGQGGWRYGLCENVDFQSQGEIPRTVKKNPETGENTVVRYYSRLSFSYTFRTEDLGSTVAFAYSVPYGYTDLQSDLEQAKANIMKADDSYELKLISREDYFESGYGNY